MFRKPCFRRAGIMREWSPVAIKRSSSIHISASPATTVSTSSTVCQWVGAPTVGATHCSNMQSCLAPLRTETCICVFTPVRQTSNGWSLWAMIVIRTYPLAIQSEWPTLHTIAPAVGHSFGDALVPPVSLPTLIPVHSRHNKSESRSQAPTNRGLFQQYQPNAAPFPGSVCYLTPKTSMQQSDTATARRDT